MYSIQKSNLMPAKQSILLATVGSSWLVWSSHALTSGEVPTNGRPVQTITTFEGIAPALPLPQENPNAALLSRTDLTEHSVPAMTPPAPKMSESCKFQHQPCRVDSVWVFDKLSSHDHFFQSSLFSYGTPGGFHGKSSS
jgi:hypothetical protein